MSDLVFYGILAFMFGYLICKERRNKTIYKVDHKCKPHHCNLRSLNTVCFERPDGKLWVKEYCHGQIKEGRTFEVGYCPFCGLASKNAMALDFHSNN